MMLMHDRKLYSQMIGPQFGNRFDLFQLDLLLSLLPFQDSPLIQIPFSHQNRFQRWPYRSWLSHYY